MQQLQHVLAQRSAVQECQGGGRRSGHASQQSAAVVLQEQGDMAACEAAVQPADPREQLQPPGRQTGSVEVSSCSTPTPRCQPSTAWRGTQLQRDCEPHAPRTASPPGCMCVGCNLRQHLLLRQCHKLAQQR